MIALNELLENFETYQIAYSEMGLKINLSIFVRLENKRKETQLQAEKVRSECNNLCKQVAEKRKQQQDTSALISQIDLLDKTHKKLQNQLNCQGKKIDKKLKKLRNIPDTMNKKHLQIQTQKTESTVAELKQFLGTICKSQHSELMVSEYLEDQKNKLFKENELPQMIICKNGILLLCSAREYSKLTEKLINYLSNNAKSIVKHSIYKMKKSSSSEYFVHLMRKTYLKIAFKKEFYTREYKIKYRDTQIDMTKFVNQINIMV